jgi:hypothetical protein
VGTRRSDARQRGPKLSGHDGELIARIARQEDVGEALVPLLAADDGPPIAKCN